MKILPTLLLFGFVSAFAQKSPQCGGIAPNVIVCDRDTYGLTSEGSLFRLDLTDKKRILISDGVSAVAQSKGELWYGKENGEVYAIGKNLKSKRENRYDSRVNGLFWDKKGNLAVMLSDSFLFRGKYLKPDARSSMFWRAGTFHPLTTFQSPDVTFQDNQDRIWFGYDAGEWGGDLCIFDLKTEQFETAEFLFLKYDQKYGEYPKNNAEYREFSSDFRVKAQDTLYRIPCEISVNEIKGIAQDKLGNIFLTQDFLSFVVNGRFEMYSFPDNDDFALSHHVPLIEYEITPELSFDGKKNFSHEIKESIGPVSFNHFDDRIYYYTSCGFFRVEKDGNQFSKTFICDPVALLSRQTNSAISRLGIRKFEFIDRTRIVFSTCADEFGYFDGKNVFLF